MHQQPHALCQVHALPLDQTSSGNQAIVPSDVIIMAMTLTISGLHDQCKPHTAFQPDSVANVLSQILLQQIHAL